MMHLPKRIRFLVCVLVVVVVLALLMYILHFARSIPDSAESFSHFAYPFARVLGLDDPSDSSAVSSSNRTVLPPQDCAHFNDTRSQERRRRPESMEDYLRWRESVRFDCFGSIYSLWGRDELLERIRAAGYPLNHIPEAVEVESWMTEDAEISEQIDAAEERYQAKFPGESHFMSFVFPFRPDGKTRCQELQSGLSFYTLFFADRLRRHEAKIVVMTQTDLETSFNKAMIMNLAVRESPCETDYFVFTDVDFLAESGENAATWCPIPVHRCYSSRFEYKVPYWNNIGGMVQLSRAVMDEVNGWSNQYWGYGAEDDDMAFRLETRYAVKELEEPYVIRPPAPLGRLYHVDFGDGGPKKEHRLKGQTKIDWDRNHLMLAKHLRMTVEGLSTLRYQVSRTQEFGHIALIEATWDMTLAETLSFYDDPATMNEIAKLK